MVYISGIGCNFDKKSEYLLVTQLTQTVEVVERDLLVAVLDHAAEEEQLTGLGHRHRRAEPRTRTWRVFNSPISDLDLRFGISFCKFGLK